MEKKKEDRVEEENNTDKKRKRKQVFPFGNYRNYYGYRIAEGVDEDPRLKVLKKEWFQGKRCLDIGCNSGFLTIQIAKKFHCQNIFGIDIDSSRIEDAHWHLRKFVKMEQAEKKCAKAPKLDVAEKADGSENGVIALSIKEEVNSRDCAPPVERDLSDIVSFRQENFVHSRHTPEKYYDTIICLSVTKWIHLNWGDDGLITSFAKIWKLLRPGGTFVLEPQPWKSYEKNRRVSETTAINYSNIMFHPEQFQEILLDKIGFRTVEDISSGCLSGSKTGFDRPIFAFHK
ncbi:hypothetical protein ACOSP7_015329 [Xanthoceras sorbifolium]|uniref:RNA methyltransferase n=1 Tax=Xanthoceras sorbifolium TaxID=99658 RepID=A0ABQ8I6K7_9ROSI|nr:hypothetical protein JRO89_XS04G0229500 [Xanthoceras sorbifolium]